jgi:hypothetical protein
MTHGDEKEFGINKYFADFDGIKYNISRFKQSPRKVILLEEEVTLVLLLGFLHLTTTVLIMMIMVIIIIINS